MQTNALLHKLILLEHYFHNIIFNFFLYFVFETKGKSFILKITS